MRQGQLSICFPSYYKVSIDVIAGWAVSPVDTRSPFNSWSNASEVSCLKKQQLHQSILSGNQTCNPLISTPVPWPLPYLATHTQACMHARMCTHTRAHAHAHTKHTCTYTCVCTHKILQNSAPTNKFAHVPSCRNYTKWSIVIHLKNRWMFYQWMGFRPKILLQLNLINTICCTSVSIKDPTANSGAWGIL